MQTFTTKLLAEIALPNSEKERLWLSASSETRQAEKAIVVVSCASIQTDQTVEAGIQHRKMQRLSAICL